ncbi:hypothetical protein EJ05DRAFT_183377 [Pseudovirgaria hyperparasitica]|uniref:Zn(2)-C6 fungal-type domain-containing protein n=1 Tax=Pseudovirgaria hyperparasitica TaxID=470096 RepID=A0A6A6WG42_9PEZI|nr:uncharacterized protein EJ05DRAFT_183377 [Pseudovirgaria hyperparasitica]KAF2761733.1 hypothetical protein EJ05DRAFT_183377 [Pseudovirgaria hyperparasitica]
MQNDPGQVQGLNLVWAASARPSKRLSEEQKAQRKKKKETGTCPRCKKLKRVCEEYRANLYLPCVYCMTSKPKSITETCQLVANLLEIKFFRLGPPTDNSSHPLNFFRHRSNVFNVTNDPLAETLNIELTQDVGCSLHLKVSRFAADPNDKLAYEGNTRGVPYRLEMPPYCIGDIAAAERSIVQYMIQAKGSYFLQFLDKSNSLLRMTFDIICKRPMTSLVHKAMDIWAATRLIERTWKLCGTETFGIHPTNRDDDPWIGHVPVTPIMDQQLDQVVIQKILRPRRGILLRELKLRMYSDDLRKKNMFDIYLTLLILLNNAEMHLAGEREFALRYGFGGRYGPFGKYRDAQEQFHAARTMLGHFHYICRANDIFDMTPDYLSKHLALTTMEVQYLAWLKTYVKTEKVNMALIREQDQYETTGYWFHQMFDKQWKPGTGYIKEIVEKGAVVR